VIGHPSILDILLTNSNSPMIPIQKFARMDVLNGDRLASARSVRLFAHRPDRVPMIALGRVHPVEPV
jgi:hypothetical protein